MKIVEKFLKSFGLRPKDNIDIEFAVMVFAALTFFNVFIFATVFKLRKRSIVLSMLIVSAAFIVNLIVFVYGIDYLFT